MSIRLTSLKSTFFINRHTFSNLILITILFELFLLGGGRFVDIGPLSLRMILFFLAQIFTIIALFYHNIDLKLFIIFIFFIILLSISTLVGILDGAALSLVFEDIKPLSYFIMIFFFSLLINSEQKVFLVENTIKICSFILMFAYLTILTGIYFNYIDFNSFYSQMNETGEVFFRPNIGFFYKGFLYLNVGFLFFLFSDKKSHKLIAALLLLAIILTFTRGLFLSVGATLLIYMVFFVRKNLNNMMNIALSVIFVVLISPWFFAQLGDRSTSDNVRIVTYEQVKESITPFSFFFGHGFGVGVEERPVHMEISYLEIFHKQGLVGLFFWLLILVMVMWSYLKIRKKENRLIALPFVLSVVLIYIQTATNPFLNNPIGMSMVLITLSVMRVLGVEKKSILRSYQEKQTSC